MNIYSGVFYVRLAFHFDIDEKILHKPRKIASLLKLKELLRFQLALFINIS